MYHVVLNLVDFQTALTKFKKKRASFNLSSPKTVLQLCNKILNAAPELNPPLLLCTGPCHVPETFCVDDINVRFAVTMAEKWMTNWILSG